MQFVYFDKEINANTPDMKIFSLKLPQLIRINTQQKIFQGEKDV